MLRLWMPLLSTLLPPLRETQTRRIQQPQSPHRERVRAPPRNRHQPAAIYPGALRRAREGEERRGFGCGRVHERDAEAAEREGRASDGAEAVQALRWGEDGARFAGDVGVGGVG